MITSRSHKFFVTLAALGALATPAHASGLASSQRRGATEARPSRQQTPRAHEARGDAKGEAERLVAQGVAALEAGDERRARGLFERAAALDPASVEAHTYLGALLDSAGDAAAAERHFAAAARAAPRSAPALSNHGASLMRLGRAEEAADEFAAALRADPSHAGALFNLAQIRFASATPEAMRESYELLRRAHASAPDAEIARALVVVSLRLGDRQSAARHFADYSAAVKNAPQASAGAASTPARAQLGAALAENGLVDEAASELAAASSAEPANADYVVALARAHLARKDVRAAGVALESAVARGVKSAPVYAALAEVYEASGHVENAIPAMRLAIEADPRSESYRFRYGMLLTDTKAPAAAVIRLEEALREFPRSSRLWFALGVAQTALNKIEEAAKSFARSNELDARFAPALAYLGMTHDQAGRYDEAVKLYERALALDTRLAAPHYLAAEAILKQPEPDTARAESHLKSAVSLDPRFAPARVSLAKLYLRDGRAAEALNELEAALAADPDLADTHYQMGRALQRLKRAEESQVAFANFKRLSEERRERERTEPKDIMRRLANVRF